MCRRIHRAWQARHCTIQPRRSARGAPGIAAARRPVMRLPARLLTLSSLSSLWLVGCGGSPHRELQVMSYTPQGSVDHAGSVEIRFDKPVVDEAMVGKPVAAGSVGWALHAALRRPVGRRRRRRARPAVHAGGPGAARPRGHRRRPERGRRVGRSGHDRADVLDPGVARRRPQGGVQHAADRQPRSRVPVGRWHRVPGHRRSRDPHPVPADGRRPGRHVRPDARASGAVRVHHRRRHAAAVDAARDLRARGQREGLPGVVAQRRQARDRVRGDPARQAGPAAHHRPPSPTPPIRR